MGVTRRNAMLSYNAEARAPIVGRETGWVQRIPMGDIVNGWHTRFQRYPALIRIFARKDPYNFPIMSEVEMMKSLEILWRDSTVRRGIRVLDLPPGTDLKTQELLEYIRSNQLLESAWIRHSGNARSQFNGSRPVMESIFDGARLTPFEIAHMRIPDQITHDDNVVFMVAACQGLTTNHVKAFLGDDSAYPDVCRSEFTREGLRKFVENRHVRFALVAPYMTQFGVDIEYAGFTRTVRRMEFLLDHPYHATLEELDWIERSASYREAWPRAMKPLSLTKKARRSPPPTRLYFPNRKGQRRGEDVSEWAIWKRGKQRPGGY